MSTRIREKQWRALAPKAFTANGTINGIATVADTRGLKVKQKIILQSSTQERVEFEVKDVLNKTQFVVGLKTDPIDKTSDISMFLVSDGAMVYAEKQIRPNIPDKEYERAVYAEEPIIAKRVILVDEEGGMIDSIVDQSGTRRLAVDALVNVEIDADIGSNIAISRHEFPIRVTTEADFASGDLDNMNYTEILSYTSADDKTRIRKITVKADTYGTFKLLKEGVTEEYFKTSFSDRNCIFEFEENIDLLSGEEITIEFVPERIRLANYNFFMRVEGYLDTP